MSIRRFKNKRDANEPVIVQAFKSHGWAVERTDQPLDLIAAYRGQTWLIEVKLEGKPLEPHQADFIDTWPGLATVVRSIEDVAELTVEARDSERERAAE